jgi:malate dehydrogenase (oxaloacetate-decarboxylating)
MGRPPRLAVIGDTDTDRPPDLPGLRVVPATAALLSHPVDVDAVYLGGVDQVRARRLKADFTARSRLPCLTREEMTAVGLAGRLSVLLARNGRPLATARVVIVESTAIPTLCPLLLALGIGDIVSWEPTDALSYPLRRITYRSDAVIDPLGGGVPVVLPSTDEGQPPLVAADDPAYPLLALPGLVRALLAKPGARADFDVLKACAHALAARTGEGRWSPDQGDPELTPLVLAMASRVLSGLDVKR